MKNIDVKQSGHNCLLDRLPKKKLTHDMVKRCKKKHCVVPELANRHRLTLRRVFTGHPNALSSHTYGVKPKKNTANHQAFEFRKRKIESGLKQDN